ncbi:M12 family metallo-peptidase, partial [Polaribacter sp.]|nr:M12 family metallo-peptidase [Polaribacter sp.]
MKKITLTFLLCLTVSISFSQSKIWKTTTEKGEFQGHSIEKLDANNSAVLALDFVAFQQQLENAPLRGVAARVSKTLISLPNNKGVMQAFNMIEAPVFSASLSAKYPAIKSYIGYSTDNSGAVVRMSVSPKGVQTMISYRDQPTVYMQPLKDDVDNYIVYNRRSKINLPKEDFICTTADELVKDTGLDMVTQRDADDQTLRKFRLAISVNGEYTAYHGGTVAGALAAINATMARVNAVFETDMAVTFEVQDFPELIYTDAGTDPYSGSLSAWNVELQNTLTSTIGNAAYDIGHMFGASGGGGNAGCIGCVCVDDSASTSDKNKGAGITSPADGIPEGDNFDIDYVAHEIGHQMGANHTFSHSTEGAGVNAEPGSGSTIMGYAGITGSNNVVLHSDAYFHYHSIRQITDNVTNTRTCWQENDPVTLTNNPPNANAGNDYTIPQGTAYVLRGTATDADEDDDLLYCWEGTDSGQVTSAQFGPTRTIGSMARSLAPTSSPNRYIPKLSRVVSGDLTQTNPIINSAWETVASVSRDLNWALTVRDRASSATGLNGQSSFDLMKITVDDTSGPFAITSQTTAEEWDAGSTKTITWDVAGTASGAVNTPKVNILLSTDGGLTFPYTLGSDVDNNGTYTFTVPVTGEGDTTEARIIVEGKDNIFYAMNATNFTIKESEFAIAVSNPALDVCAPDDAVYNFTYNTFLGFTGTTTFSADGLPTGATATFSPATATADGTEVTATISGIGSVSVGQYSFKITGTSDAITKESDVTLGVYSGSPEAITLTAPSDGNTGVSLTPTLTWEADANAASYDVEIATDSAFTGIVASENVTTNSYNLSGLEQTITYFWRVKGRSICGDGVFSPTFSFTTISCTVCESVGNTTYQTSTTLVQFNTIDNPSAKPSGYSDYTAIATTVKKGDTHELTINVNTDGNFTVHTVVWIDWNQDCDFLDTGENFDLGDALNTADGATTLSPLSITIPEGASLGSTTMRVSTKYSTDPASCTDATFDGEVEDYTVTVEEATATIEDFAFSGFNLYPNPSKGTFNLNFDVVNTEKVVVQLFDIRGRLIGEKNFLDTNT